MVGLGKNPHEHSTDHRNDPDALRPLGPRIAATVGMTKEFLRELLLRQLGLKHKLKVHDSVKQPETHEEIAANQLARWDLEDEIHAIDAILADTRKRKIDEKRKLVEKDLSGGTLTKKKKFK